MPNCFAQLLCASLNCAPCSFLGAGLFGGLPTRFGSFVAGIDLFDSGAFGMSDSEALLMDPQQRLITECTSELFMADPASGPARQQTGVYVGLSAVDYAKASRGSFFKGSGLRRVPLAAGTAWLAGCCSVL